MPKLRYFMIVFILSVAPLLTHSQDGSPHIIASHSILRDVVAQVVGDVTQVIVVMPVGADPHSFEATPTDLTALAMADVVFVNGAFYEEGLLEAIENAGTDMNIVEVSSCVEIIPLGASEHAHDEHEDEHTDDEHEEHADDEHEEHEHEEMETSRLQTLCGQHIAEFDSYHEDSHGHSDEDEHADDEHEEHEHEEKQSLGRLYAIDCDGNHNEGGCDPHVWMEPHNVMYWTMIIRDTLIELDPDHATTYQANAAAYLDELDGLVHDFVKPLIDTLPEEQRILITSHDSLGYLARAFDFELIGTIIPGGTTVAEPSVRDVADLIDLINAENVPAIFGETTVNASIAESIAAETDAELVVLYSGSLSDADNPAATYLDYIRYNYTTIIESLRD